MLKILEILGKIETDNDTNKFIEDYNYDKNQIETFLELDKFKDILYTHDADLKYYSQTFLDFFLIDTNFCKALDFLFYINKININASFTNTIKEEFEICKFGFNEFNLEFVLIITSNIVLFFTRPLFFHKKTKIKNVVTIQNYFLNFLKENLFEMERFFFEKIVIPMPYTILIFKKKGWSLFLKELLNKQKIKKKNFDQSNVDTVYKITLQYLCI